MVASLRARLTGAVMLPLAALVLTFGGIACWVIAGTLQTGADRTLIGAARTISVALKGGAGTAAHITPLAAQLQQHAQPATFYSVHHGEQLVAGTAALAPPPALDLNDRVRDRNAPASFPDAYRRVRPHRGYIDAGDAAGVIQAAYLRDGDIAGRSARIATETRLVPGDPVPWVIQVADHADDRRSYIFGQCLQVIGGGVLILMIAVLLFYEAVLWGLKPFLDLTEQIESARDNPPAHFRLSRGASTPAEAISFITAFNGLMARMEKATESLRHFTTHASHQMRTPLAIARIHLGLLDRFGPGSPQGKTALNDISHAIESLERLLQQLISLARTDEQAIDSGMSFDLVETTANVLGERIGHLSDHDVDVIYEQDEQGVIPVKGHPLLAAELISNLVDNAIRYNRPGGSVVIRLGRQGGHGRIEIEDDGPGIPDKDRERVWERFYRGAAEADRVGSGLGLSIVRSLADRMGAQVSLNSGAEGRGVCATVDFQQVA